MSYIIEMMNKASVEITDAEFSKLDRKSVV